MNVLYIKENSKKLSESYTLELFLDFLVSKI